MTFTLPDQAALVGLAETLAKLLAVGEAAKENAPPKLAGEPHGAQHSSGAVAGR